MKARSAAKPPKSPTPPQPLLPTSSPTAARDPKSPASPAKAVTLKRISTLYNELKIRDAKSRYPWRGICLAFFGIVVFFLCQFLASGLFSLFPSLVDVGVPGFRTSQRYEQIFYNDSDFAYIPESKVFLTTTAQAGSTTFWTWLHRGVTGLPSFDECNYTYIQNFQAPCWKNKVIHPYNLSSSERWRIVNGRDVLRIAITRDPFERLISAWKSKAACDADDFATDVHDRDNIVPILLRQAGMQKYVTCLSLLGFAELLDRLRVMEEKGEYNFKAMDKHFRPQELHAQDIPYDIVVDVKELTNMTVLAPLVKRLKHAYLLTGPPKLLHASLPSGQTMSEATAAALFRFALLTERVPPRRVAD